MNGNYNNTDNSEVMRISKKNDSLNALNIIYVVIIEKMILEFTLLWIDLWRSLQANKWANKANSVLGFKTNSES